MDNPWEEISLSDYEKHMSLNSVRQLQSMNHAMKSQLEAYDVSTAMILGIAGGNGLEHVDKEKYHKVYGVDVNADYLKTTAARYENLSGVLECLHMDLINQRELLPGAELVIANLLVEYIGYDVFAAAVEKIGPQYVSCIIQINDDSRQWVSDSPYIHAFDGLEKVHCQMDEQELIRTMRGIGYALIVKETDTLPNGKSLVRLDFGLSE